MSLECAKALNSALPAQKKSNHLGHMARTLYA